MISVEKALKFVHSQKVILKSGLSISTRNGLGYVLSDDLIAPISLPNFRQSSMDGYGLSDTKSLTYKVVGEIKAGDYYKKKINKGEAIRIFTGAHVPDSVKSVVIQEKVVFENNNIKLDELPKLYSNIREKGDQIKKGEIVLKKGFLLNEASLGLISSLGIKKIKVYEKPKVSILITGNELISIDKKLKPGKVYDSNSILLKNVLRMSGITKLNLYKVRDNKKHTFNSIKKAFIVSDLVIISGGISVGKYDYVKECLNDLGIKKLFYKVNQKPGKPLFFGRKDNKFVFALPGNPGSTLTCYHIYVKNFIYKLMGKKKYYSDKFSVYLKHPLKYDEKREVFLKGYYENNYVTSLNHQKSFKMIGFANANCLIHLEKGKKNLKENSKVDIILI